MSIISKIISVIIVAYSEELLFPFQILHEMGGIYLDFDTLVIRPFDDLRKYTCVIGTKIITSYLYDLSLTRKLKGAEFSILESKVSWSRK